jgi:poly(A) polymerase
MQQAPRPELHKDWINPEAYEIVDRLQDAGFKAYLVGGCVRDLLLGKIPKDYDVATDARPQQIRRIIPQCYIIGKRFRLVLAKRGEELFEIATFRRDPTPEEAADPELEGDNLFGTTEEDAHRRDFTVNSLFFDPVNGEILNYCEGREDLELGLVRMIGAPMKRLAEDPIRILRAIRLANLIRFRLEPELRKSIAEQAHLLEASALPRRREEYLKFLRLEDPSMAFLTCEDLGVLPHVLPTLAKILHSKNGWRFFYSDLRGFHNFTLASPTELFGGFMLSVCKLHLGIDVDSEDLRSFDISDDPDLAKLMRDELGMFKLEQSLFTKAVRMLPLLRKRREFLQRGPKRRLALLNNEAFPLSLCLAEREVLLSVEDLQGWRHDLANHKPTHSSSGRGGPRSGAGAGPGRRRRRRRRN